jgi:hypothetical protein
MAQSELAIRNRQIKTTLESIFGKGKVTVRGSRGTGYGWVSVHVDWTPLDSDQSARMHAECKALLHAAKIDLGHSFTDDTCQYTSDQCHLSFNRARYFRAIKHADGSLSVIRDYYESNWEDIPATA